MLSQQVDQGHGVKVLKDRFIAVDLRDRRACIDLFIDASAGDMHKTRVKLTM